jgi:hypothetical protein
MSKADTLLKKATFYERMAIYSDRKTFLQALAQPAPVSHPGDLEEEALNKNKQLIGRALQLMQQSNVDSNITAPLGNAVIFNKIDIPAIKKVIENVRLTGKISPLSPAWSELNSIMSQLQNTSSLTQDPGVGESPMVFDHPTDRITGFAPIDQEQQEALSRFVTVNGLGLPLRVDGKLGPDTRKALDAFKKYLTEKNPEKPKLSDAQALETVKFIIDNSPQRYT